VRASRPKAYSPRFQIGHLSYNGSVSDYRPGEREETVDWAARSREAEEEYHLSQLRGYEPIHPDPTWKTVVRRLWVPIAFVGAILWKFKAAAVAVFKFKFVGTALSGLVSIAAYALLWSWWFAVGLVVLLFIHEMGHVLEARRQGLPTSAPMFIPFMGALIMMKQLPDDVWREARVALAGPIIGTIGAIAFWIVGAATERDFFTAMAYVGFFLNLFNLLPIVPLDGGRAVAALHPTFWLVGLLGLVALLIVMPNPILILILIIGGMELWSRWRHRGSEAARTYYSITRGRRLAVGVTYLGLAAFLVLAMGATHIERDI
jgi:Zn-dependent protease